MNLRKNLVSEKGRAAAGLQAQRGAADQRVLGGVIETCLVVLDGDFVGNELMVLLYSFWTDIKMFFSSCWRRIFNTQERPSKVIVEAKQIYVRSI